MPCARPGSLRATAADYCRAGLPWFDYYGGDAEALEGAERLAGLKSVKEMGAANGETPLPENESVQVNQVIGLSRKRSGEVREMPL